jgi:DHA3 family macrolide efflux protein-like MFS transporter
MFKEQWKKDTTIFITSQVISLFGSSLVTYAIMWYITLTTQSGVMMTISIVCGALPAVLLSPVAGVWADRYDRKKMIMLSDLFIAFTTFIIALLFIAGHDAIILLFVASALRAVGTGIQTPSVGAILPQFVPEDKLTKVNGLFGSVQSTVMLISPMLSAVLLTFTSLELIFFIDVVTAVIAVGVLFVFLKVPPHKKALTQEKGGYYGDFLLGMNYIKTHSFLKKFFIFQAILMFLVAPVALLSPLQVTRSFGNDVWRLTAIEITFSMGMILGGILIANWGGFRNRVHTMILSCIVIALCTFLLGIIPIFWLYLVVMGMIGISLPIYNTPAMVILQEKVEMDYMGRVFGVMGMIGSLMMPLGMVLFGSIADIIKIEWLLIVTGILVMIQSLLLIRSKGLIAAGNPKDHLNDLIEEP